VGSCRRRAVAAVEGRPPPGRRRRGQPPPPCCRWAAAAAGQPPPPPHCSGPEPCGLPHHGRASRAPVPPLVPLRGPKMAGADAPTALRGASLDANAVPRSPRVTGTSVVGEASRGPDAGPHSPPPTPCSVLARLSAGCDVKASQIPSDRPVKARAVRARRAGACGTAAPGSAGQRTTFAQERGVRPGCNMRTRAPSCQARSRAGRSAASGAQSSHQSAPSQRLTGRTSTRWVHTNNHITRLHSRGLWDWQAAYDVIFGAALAAMPPPPLVLLPWREGTGADAWQGKGTVRSSP
jgi:hypothetical protein